MRLRDGDSLLLVVDAQARLAPKIEDADRIVANCAVLIEAAARLAVDVLATEHYSRGLGPLLPELKAHLPVNGVLEKIHFSLQDEPACAVRVAQTGRRQMVIAGMETHVCVLQSALGLRQAGYEVFVVADATGSRRAESRALALERMRAAGIAVVTTEMVVFEWLGRADRPEFRDVLALIK
jgi:nicotinamidase-related amidase